MPAVTIKADGRAPARARRRPPRRWVRVRPAAPLDPDRRQRLGTPGRRSNSKRRDCRSGRGGRAVRPLGYGLLRPPGRRDGTTTRPRTAGWSSYSPARPTSANRTGATEALPVWTEELRDPVAAARWRRLAERTRAGRAGRSASRSRRSLSATISNSRTLSVTSTRPSDSACAAISMSLGRTNGMGKAAAAAGTGSAGGWRVAHAAACAAPYGRVCSSCQRGWWWRAQRSVTVPSIMARAVPG